MSFDEPAIDVRGVGKRYEVYQAPRDRLKQMILPRLHDWSKGAIRPSVRPRPQYFKEFWALKEVSFQVGRGESVGVIGRNGSGKSTLLQIIAGTLAPTLGQVVTQGRIAALLELGSGFNPEFTGRENVYLNSLILGLSQDDVDRRIDEILAFADIGEFVDRPVKIYSSGMFLRLAFAVQAHIDAAVVLIDEALAVGDIFFRQKCYSRLEKLRASGAAIVLVSHSMPDIEQFCERAVLLNRGELSFVGPSSEAAKRYYLAHQERVVSSPGAARVPESTVTTAGSLDVESGAPTREAFLDLSGITQVTDGRANCIAVALCDVHGNACRSFRQGDIAVFVYEFELADAIDVPIGGVLFSNERGVIVHGKNSWQDARDVPHAPQRGSRLRYRHEVRLDLAIGEYVFEVGLATVAASTWASRETISHETMDAMHDRLCHLPAAGSFSVGYAVRPNGVPILTHHGVANLPHSITVTALHPPR